MKHTSQILVLMAAAVIGFVSSQVLGQTTTGVMISELSKEKASLLTVGITTLNLTGAGNGLSAALDNGQIVIGRVKLVDSPADVTAIACARVLADIRAAGNVNPATGDYRAGVYHSQYSQHFVQVELRETPDGKARMREIDRQLVVSATVEDRKRFQSKQCSGMLMSTEAK